MFLESGELCKKRETGFEFPAEKGAKPKTEAASGACSGNRRELAVLRRQISNDADKLSKATFCRFVVLGSNPLLRAVYSRCTARAEKGIAHIDSNRKLTEAQFFLWRFDCLQSIKGCP